MAVDEIIISPELTPCLTTAQQTLAQALTIISLLESSAASPTTTELQRNISKQQKLLQAYLSRLRSQTRRAAYLARTTKSQTGDARREVDALLLQLQNLYYEQRHLLDSINSCSSYPHAYQDLPLMDEDEYLGIFPDDADLSEQHLMAKRIEYEATERRQLEEDRLELVKRKEELVTENARRKEKVKAVDEKLEAWVDGLAALETELKGEL